jgi:hypothetical protein
LALDVCGHLFLGQVGRGLSFLSRLCPSARSRFGGSSRLVALIAFIGLGPARWR